MREGSPPCCSLYGEMTITRGGQAQSSDPLGQHWAYTGRFYDEESGLYHYRTRAYDPATGRFLQRDPQERSVSTCDYQYCVNSPTGLVDPLGLNPEEPTLEDGLRRADSSAGAYAGGLLGAKIGSAVLPGPGSFIGGLVGAAAGGFCGYYPELCWRVLAGQRRPLFSRSFVKAVAELDAAGMEDPTPVTLPLPIGSVTFPRGWLKAAFGR